MVHPQLLLAQLPRLLLQAAPQLIARGALLQGAPVVVEGTPQLQAWPWQQLLDGELRLPRGLGGAQRVGELQAVGQ